MKYMIMVGIVWSITLFTSNKPELGRTISSSVQSPQVNGWVGEQGNNGAAGCTCKDCLQCCCTSCDWDKHCWQTCCCIRCCLAYAGADKVTNQKFQNLGSMDMSRYLSHGGTLQAKSVRDAKNCFDNHPIACCLPKVLAKLCVCITCGCCNCCCPNPKKKYAVTTARRKSMARPLHQSMDAIEVKENFNHMSNTETVQRQVQSARKAARRTVGAIELAAHLQKAPVHQTMETPSPAFPPSPTRSSDAETLSVGDHHKKLSDSSFTLSSAGPLSPTSPLSPLSPTATTDI